MHGLFFWNIENVLQKSLKESNGKANKMWVDKSTKSYNKSMKSWLEKITEMYSTHSKEKIVIAERLMRTLKNKLCIMTSVSKYVYIDEIETELTHTTIHIIEQLKWNLLM